MGETGQRKGRIGLWGQGQSSLCLKIITPLSQAGQPNTGLLSSAAAQTSVQSQRDPLAPLQHYPWLPDSKEAQAIASGSNSHHFGTAGGLGTTGFRIGLLPLWVGFLCGSFPCLWHKDLNWTQEQTGKLWRWQNTGVKCLCFFLISMLVAALWINWCFQALFIWQSHKWQ